MVEFADNLITVDERCGGGGKLVNTSKFATFVALKIVVCIVSDFVLECLQRQVSRSGGGAVMLMSAPIVVYGQ